MSRPAYRIKPNPVTGAPLRVFVLLAHSFGARRWQERWARGELAGIHERLPYGYFHCAGSHCEVEYSEDADESRLTRLVRMCCRRLLGFDLIHAWRHRENIARADVVWTHTELEYLAILLLFQLGVMSARPRLIAQSVWLFDRWPRMSRLRRWAYRRLIEEADILTVHSPENLRIARELFPHKRSELIRFGIDSSCVRPVRRREMKRPLRVLSLGNDMHRDWDTLIKAFGGRSEIQVRMGGKRIGRRLRRQTGRLANLEIVTPATAAESDRLYQWADFVVVPLKPNLHASGITVVTEAVLFGVAVICTDTGGLRTYFSDDEIRYVPIASPEHLRSAVEQLSRDSELRTAMSRRAQARIARSELDSRTFARRHFELSQLLIRSPAEPRPLGGRATSDRLADDPIRVFVFLGHGFDTSWARGDLPGINEALPYGYYHARDHGCVVAYSKDAAENRLIGFARMALRRGLGFDLIHTWRNRRAMRNADVVWTHTELECLAALALLRTFPPASRPHIIAQSVWLFGRWHEFWALKRWLYIWLLRRADLLTVQCEANLAAARRILPEVPLRVVRYGIDLEKLVPVRSRPMHNPIRILSLGRDMHRDWETLFAATAERPEFDVLIGAKRMRRRALAPGGNLALVNPTATDLPELYQWADFVVIALKPNLHASGITVLAEAALFGVPVICTGTGGLEEYFDDECVKYVAAGDSAAIRCAIDELAGDERLRFELARNSQARLLEEDLSTRARAKRLAAISRELISGKPLSSDVDLDRLSRKTRAPRAVSIAVAIGLLSVAAARPCFGREFGRGTAIDSSLAVSAEPIQLRGLGMVVKLGHSREIDDRQVELMRALGVTAVVWPPGEWAENEKTPGHYAFSPEVTHVIQELAQARIQLIVVLFRKNSLYPNPLDPDAFARYCTWIVHALKNVPVADWQIWNEPSNFDFRAQYGGSWNGRGDAPWLDNFATLTGKAAHAIKQADPRATVSVNLEGPALVYALRDRPQDFAEIDGVSIHPYSGHFPAEQVPWGGMKNFVRDGVAVADSNGSMVSSLREQSYDYPRQYLGRPLVTWITEYGFPTCETATRPEQFNCVSEPEQAAFHARGMILGFSQGARVWSVYEIADERNNRADPEQNFGITSSAATGNIPKPAFLTIQRIARILGPDWKYLHDPPATLAVSNIVTGARQDLESSRSATVSGPQMAWFSTAHGYVGFIWKAGPYDDTTTAKATLILGDNLSSRPARVIATDVVTGQTLHPILGAKRDVLMVDQLALSSRPVAVELQWR